jgi:hypothetical protein
MREFKQDERRHEDADHREKIGDRQEQAGKLYDTAMADQLRQELDRLLQGRGAHVSFDEAIEGFPARVRGVRPKGCSHSAWEVLEHLRIAQWDMLEFSRDAEHKSPNWPAGYWPSAAEPPDEEAWDRSIASFRADNQTMRDLIAKPDSDLFTPFAHGEGQSLLREAMQIADHNAYHIGELVLLRRILGVWG